MSIKRNKPEEIIQKLLQMKVLVGKVTSHQNTPKDSPKSIVPRCLGHTKGSQVKRAIDSNTGKCGRAPGQSS